VSNAVSGACRVRLIAEVLVSAEPPSFGRKDCANRFQNKVHVRANTNYPRHRGHRSREENLEQCARSITMSPTSRIWKLYSATERGIWLRESSDIRGNRYSRDRVGANLEARNSVVASLDASLIHTHTHTRRRVDASKECRHSRVAGVAGEYAIVVKWICIAGCCEGESPIFLDHDGRRHDGTGQDSRDLRALHGGVRRSSRRHRGKRFVNVFAFQFHVYLRNLRASWNALLKNISGMFLLSVPMFLVSCRAISRRKTLREKQISECLRWTRYERILH